MEKEIVLKLEDLKNVFIHGIMMGSGSYQLKKEIDIDYEFERMFKTFLKGKSVK